MLNHIQAKIQTVVQAHATLAAARVSGAGVVFTNGCFDLIHAGHLHYLAEARALGQLLIVGLNSDASVARLKGSHRPIKDEQSRALLLASLFFVDLVVIFEEDTPLNLIQALRPDILVKGGDYTEATVVGAQAVRSWGGDVQLLSFLPGHSSSKLEAKIKETAQK